MYNSLIHNFAEDYYPTKKGVMFFFPYNAQYEMTVYIAKTFFYCLQYPMNDICVDHVDEHIYVEVYVPYKTFQERVEEESCTDPVVAE